MLTIDRLREVLQYDEATGVLVWLQGHRAGKIAGCIEGEGYRIIKIDQRCYKAHRLAWFYVHGDWPVKLDHRNIKADDNRIENLRPCSTAQNLRNRQFRRGAVSGARGVYLTSAGRFRVRVSVQGRNRGFGTFDDLELAELVAMEVRNKFYGEFANHGYAASPSP